MREGSFSAATCLWTWGLVWLCQRFFLAEVVCRLFNYCCWCFEDALGKVWHDTMTVSETKFSPVQVDHFYARSSKTAISCWHNLLWPYRETVVFNFRFTVVCGCRLSTSGVMKKSAHDGNDSSVSPVANNRLPLGLGDVYSKHFFVLVI